MFTDSHTHILFTTEKISNSEQMMHSLKNEKFRFLMDIGTEPGDLKKRMECVKNISGGTVPDFIHFAAGLWPHTETIKNIESSIRALKNDITMGLEFAQSVASLKQDESKDDIEHKPAFFSIGECGLDRYWNGKDAPMLKEGGTLDIEGEKELFIQQLRLAKEHNLAVIIHSRDAYLETLRCIDYVDHHKGVIHCFSYDEDAAKSFLQRGWYISFPGNITFAKTHAAIERTRSLVASIPLNRLLLETDAPYMSPVPLRGQTNTSLNIRHTYQKASEYTGVSVPELCDIVYENTTRLFRVDTALCNS
jgi:hydrolase, tatD family